MKELTTNLESEVKKLVLGLRVNAEKTKIEHIGNNQMLSIHWSRKTYNVDRFTYLDSILTEDSDIVTPCQLQYEKGIRSVLAHEINMVEICDDAVLSTVTYRSETWKMTIHRI